MTSVTQRFIEYDVPHYYKAPPPMSFREGSALQIGAQTHRTDLNGKYVVCLGRDGMRSLVMTNSGDTLSVADSHLKLVELSAGTRVTLVGVTRNPLLNGQIGTLQNFDEAERLWTVAIEGATESHHVAALHIVVTPHGSEDATMNSQPIVGKKRRLISNLVSSASDALGPNGRPALAGAPGLLSGQPIPGATSRLIAVDAAVAMSNQQPILKRCGTLRKLVHGFPGFAQLVTCVVVKLHLDPSHPGRNMDQSDAGEAIKTAQLLTDGRLDGIPRRDLRELVSAGEVTVESVLRIADRYCGATHLVFAIDTNFAGVRDTITNMVHQITSGGVTNVAAASCPPVAEPVNTASADLLMQDVSAEQLNPVPEATAVPLSSVMTSLMANRYAKPVIPNVSAEPMDEKL